MKSKLEILKLRVYISILMCLLVACVSQGGIVRPQSLDSDLEDVLCHTVNYPSSIINIRTSMELGADLLDGILAENKDSCTSQCCKDVLCDMALYKLDGTSKSGKNCYLVHCGEPENCVMVDHEAFTSVMFQRDGLEAEGTTATTSHSFMTTTADVTTPDVTTPTINTTTTSSRKSTSTADTLQSAATTASNEPVLVAKPIMNHGQSGSLSDDADPPAHQETSSKKQHSDDCGKYGCDGSGIVAIVVVGIICFAIVLVVLAVLVKRIVDDRRKKRFRNVDYLINGMYT